MSVVPDSRSEWFCALTMLTPSIVSLVVFSNKCFEFDNVYEYVVFVQCFVHAPFSITLHLKRAFGDHCYRDGGLIIRRLDYTFIHVVSSLLCFGLSHSVLYGTLGTLLNVYCVYKIWTFDDGLFQTPPIRSVGTCVFVYLFGLVINERPCAFVYSCVVAIMFYLCILFDHYALMHLFCGVLQYVLMTQRV